jgi:type II secretory pathway pseudopilin PulG
MPFVEALASQAVSKLFGGGNSSRQSIPAPKTPEQLKADMDVVYKGTTPWERLGSQGGGLPSLAGQQDQAKIQAEMQRQAHTNNMEIARLQASKDVAVANINQAGQDRRANPFTSQGRDDIVEDVKDVVSNAKEANVPEYVKAKTNELISKQNEHQGNRRLVKALYRTESQGFKKYEDFEKSIKNNPKYKGQYIDYKLLKAQWVNKDKYVNDYKNSQKASQTVENYKKELKTNKTPTMPFNKNVFKTLYDF